MAEYIEREAAERILESVGAPAYAIHALTLAKTTDVAPVVHGRWISLEECANAGVYCSVCHKKVYKEDYAWSNKRIKMRSNYCPNCGAHMKDGE